MHISTGLNIRHKLVHVKVNLEKLKVIKIGIVLVLH
jgi:hypothetical protein